MPNHSVPFLTESSSSSVADTRKHVLLSVLSVLLVFGNGMLIITILCHKRLRTITNLFVVALAVADFLMGFLAIPMHVLGEQQLLGGSRGCLISMALTAAQIVVSVVMLFALSVERYLNLVHPFKHRKYLTRRRAILVIILGWVYALLFGLLPLFGWHTVEEYQERTQNLSIPKVCRFEFVLPGSYIAWLFLGHIIPAAIILPLLHYRVFRTAQNVLRRHADMSDHTRKTSVSSEQGETLVHRTKRNLRPFKILVMMVLYFIISWVPLTIWETFVFKGFAIDNPYPGELFSTTLEQNGYYVAVVLAVMNSVVNPLFYGVGSRNIRNTFLMAVRKTCGCRTEGEEYRFSYASVSQQGGIGCGHIVTGQRNTSQRKTSATGKKRKESNLSDCKL